MVSSSHEPPDVHLDVEVRPRIGDYSVSLAFDGEAWFVACSCDDSTDCAHAAAALYFALAYFPEGEPKSRNAKRVRKRSSSGSKRTSSAATPVEKAPPPSANELGKVSVEPAAVPAPSEIILQVTPTKASPEGSNLHVTAARAETTEEAPRLDIPDVPCAATDLDVPNAYQNWLKLVSSNVDQTASASASTTNDLPHYILHRETLGAIWLSMEAIPAFGLVRGRGRRQYSDSNRTSNGRDWTGLGADKRQPIHAPYDWFSYNLQPCDTALLQAFPPHEGPGADRAALDVKRSELWLALLQSGRAFLEHHGKRVRVVPGRSRKGLLGYSVSRKGVQRPSVQSIDATGAAREIVFFHLAPYGYLDWETGELGTLDLDMPAAHVEHWRRGPLFTPEEVTRSLIARFQAQNLAAPKPVVRRQRPLEAKVVVESVKGDYWDVAEPLARVRVLAGVDGNLSPLDQLEATARVEGDRIVLVSPPPEAIDRLRNDLTEAGFKMPSSFSATGVGLTHRYPNGELEYATRKALAGKAVTVEVAQDYAYRADIVDELAFGLGDDEQLASFPASLTITVDGTPIDVIGAVLDALRTGTWPRHAITFKREGRRFLVPVERLEPLRALLLELVGRAGPPRISRLRALALPEGVLRRAPEHFKALLHKVRSPPPVSLPSGLLATLRGYQLEGFHWLEARRNLGLGAVLADDMGLGKTVQTIALILRTHEQAADGRRPALVVAPKSVAPNWYIELRKFAPSLRVVEHHGKDRRGVRGLWAEADVVITTYPILVKDEALFVGHHFSMAVLDEAQTIKTATSSAAHAACRLNASFRLALTGTPMENHLGELWSVLRFTLPELLPEEKAFNQLYRKPIEREGDETMRTALRARLGPFLLRRTKELVASDLPSKTVTTTMVELEAAQRDVYETVRAAMNERVRDALATRGLARSHVVVLDALLKLRQAVCDPRLLKTASAKKAGSAKLDHLLEVVTELVAEGRRVLVFSQFVQMLELVERELDRAKIPYLMLTGQTEGRGELVAEFQRGKAPVFLLSLKAGGSGLNLTAADVVIHYDPWWNPAVENQATDRAHRIGQTQPVFVYKLIGRDTIEEKVLGLQARKQALFSSILDEGAGIAKVLDEEDLAYLFS